MVYEALAAKQLDYYIWVAVKKVSDNWKKYVPLPCLFTILLKVAQGWMGYRAKGMSDKGTASTREWHSGPNTYTLPLSLFALKPTQILELANAISDRIPGPYFGLADPRKHADTSYLMENAHSMYGLLQHQGIPRNDIIISVSNRLLKVNLNCMCFWLDRFQQRRRVFTPRNSCRRMGSISICAT